jgi:hypothetical protein
LAAAAAAIFAATQTANIVKMPVFADKDANFCDVEYAGLVLGMLVSAIVIDTVWLMKAAYPLHGRL